MVVCKRLATHLNLERLTDYEAHGDKPDPPDVVLKSRSGKHPSIDCEVVSVPSASKKSGWLHRDDRDDVRKVEHQIENLLSEEGVGNCAVDVRLAQHTTPYALLSKVNLDGLLTLVRECQSPGLICLTGPQVNRLAEGLAQRVRQVTVQRDPAIESPIVRIPPGGVRPMDGRWIADAVTAKLQHYGTCVASGLTLVVDAAWTVSHPQIKAFIEHAREHPHGFRDMWIIRRWGKIWHV